ncbi:glycosyltransferase family 4 protein [soil metagenome]
MRILLANEFFYPDVMGGTPKVLSELARALRDGYGDEIDVVTSMNSYRDPSVRFSPWEKWDGIRIHRLNTPHWSQKSTPQRLLGNLLFTRRAAARMQRIPADVALISSAPTTLPAAGRRLKVPYVYVLYDLDPDRAVVVGVTEMGSLPERTLRRHQRRWLHGAARVVVIGRCMRRYVSETYGVPLERIDVVEVGADPLTVRPLPKASAFRREHGIAGFVVLYSGNFGKYHDFDTVLNAANLLEDVTFVLVGRGAKKAHLESRVAAEGIRNVRLFDFVPEEAYADLLASADVSLVTLEAGMEGLCVPSKFYSILASGRPALAAMRPEAEVAYVLQEADCGRRVDLNDSEALANAVRTMQADPEGLEQMGANARRAFDEKYTTAACAARFREALARVVGQRSQEGKQRE